LVGHGRVTQRAEPCALRAQSLELRVWSLAFSEMLERLEDVEDLRMLEEMRRKPLKFRGLEEFLSG
jgi:hypothetical protein